MTLKKAVEILNERKHDECQSWSVSHDGLAVGFVGCQYLDPFEAIAIAKEFVTRDMTLERAVEILNEHKHRGLGLWAIKAGGATGAVGEMLSAFEAVAVAEKYLREG